MIVHAPQPRTARRAGALPLALALLLSPFAARAELVCPNVPGPPPIELPDLRGALDHGSQGVIVALGSSSTRGTMASDLSHSYPAVLQKSLSEGLPGTHIVVLNRGIGGQDAAEELARLEVDVIAVRPQVVIWQVGANGALRNVDPAIFRHMVTSGVQRLQSAGANVVLMDNQEAPRLLATPREPLLDQALADVAKQTGAALFSRKALMEAWQRNGEPFTDFIAADGLHHNDRGYVCVGRSLAGAIIAGLAPHSPLSASR